MIATRKNKENGLPGRSHTAGGNVIGFDTRFHYFSNNRRTGTKVKPPAAEGAMKASGERVPAAPFPSQLVNVFTRLEPLACVLPSPTYLHDWGGSFMSPAAPKRREEKSDLT